MMFEFDFSNIICNHERVTENVISVKLLLQWKPINLLTHTRGHDKNLAFFLLNNILGNVKSRVVLVKQCG